ncbi:MAG: hypothetical protein WC604_04125 [Candidatus Gracilibacteria bacterium]
MTDDQNQKQLAVHSGEKLKEALASAVTLPPEEQKKLNEPLKDPSGLNETNRTFLNDVIPKIEKGQIDLHAPSSLINQEVYQKLSEQVQGETDLSAVTLLARLGEIKGLHDLGQTDSYQFENLVEQVRSTKERVEKDAGDVFII